jgi:hypothetical protein
MSRTFGAISKIGPEKLSRPSARFSNPSRLSDLCPLFWFTGTCFFDKESLFYSIFQSSHAVGEILIDYPFSFNFLSRWVCCPGHFQSVPSNFTNGIKFATLSCGTYDICLQVRG